MSDSVNDPDRGLRRRRRRTINTYTVIIMIKKKTIKRFYILFKKMKIFILLNIIYYLLYYRYLTCNLILLLSRVLMYVSIFCLSFHKNLIVKLLLYRVSKKKFIIYLRSIIIITIYYIVNVFFSI